MTHVFVVNEKTFNIHLQYLFAGTGYSDNEPDLMSISGEKYYAENTLTGMIADISKVRVGDKVLFYVTGCKKFFGIFEIEDSPFFEPYSSNYLGKELDKYLPFRVKIKPYKVYSRGVSEQLALDDISTINRPYEMCWSMIYRKLTGMRGCSFVTDSEMERLEELLSFANESNYLSGENYYYDNEKQQIIVSTIINNYSAPTNIPLTIDTRLYNVRNSHENHLQAFITQNFDRNQTLKSKLFPNSATRIWIGNEVVCSVGEKRIDILTIAETDKDLVVRIIELKDERPTAGILKWQLPWYIKWVDQYLVPGLLSKKKNVIIIPTIFAYPYNRNTKIKKEFDSKIIEFNEEKQKLVNNGEIRDIECYYFDRTAFPIKIY